MSATLADRVGRPWRKPPLIKSAAWRWGLGIAALIYLVLAVGSIEVNWSRVYEGLDRGWKFVAAFANPDFTSRASDISEGLIESVIITITSTVVGIAISIPIALGAAGNIAPVPVYLVCRAIVALSRALNEIIVAILLVAIFGFSSPFFFFLRFFDDFLSSSSASSSSSLSDSSSSSSSSSSSLSSAAGAVHSAASFL